MESDGLDPGGLEFPASEVLKPLEAKSDGKHYSVEGSTSAGGSSSKSLAGGASDVASLPDLEVGLPCEGSPDRQCQICLRWFPLKAGCLG
jgi:hypothetical protein